MSNNTTEQALIQIERNLDKLESARKHVLDVTKSSGEISSIMLELVNKVEEVLEGVNLESDSFLKIFEANSQKLDQHTAKILVKSEKSINSLSDQFKVLNTSFAENINKTVELSTTNAHAFLEQQKKAFENHYVLIKDFNTAVLNLKNSLNNIDFETFLTPLENKLDENFIGVATKFEELTKAVTILTRENQSLHNESTQNITTVLQDLHAQNSALQKRNIELTEAILNKKDNKAIFFLLTWFIMFLGLLMVVFILKKH